MSGNVDKSQIVLPQSFGAEINLPKPPRMFFIDNMRIILIILVIVGHMAITYGAPIGDWYYHEVGEVSTIFSILTILLLGIGASFLLGLFFMIAGYFSPGQLKRKGVKKFIIDRLVRLGIPLLVYALIINPLVTYWAAGHGGYVGSLIQYVKNHPSELQNASVGPLWFVEALLVFSLTYAILYSLNLRKDHSLRDHTSVSIPKKSSIVLFSFSLGLVTFLVRIWMPFGRMWEPAHQEPAHLPQYVAMFFVGIVAYRNKWLEAFPSQQARIWGWVSLFLIPCFPALAIAAGALEGEFSQDIAGGFTWLSLGYSMWEAFIGVALVISTLIWFRNRLNHQGSFMRKMAGSAYGVYVLHPLIIVPLTLALSGLQMNLNLKFVLFTPVAVILCFLVAFLFRKLPLIKHIL